MKGLNNNNKRRQHKLAALFLSYPLPQRTSNNLATS
nr:MAG TPA: hypothetical protein [Caudoviricetes sp.]